MPETNISTIDSLGLELVSIFTPLKARVDEGEFLFLLAELGVQFPDSLRNNVPFSNAMSALGGNLTAMPVLVKDLITAAEAENWNLVGEKSVQLAEKIALSVEAFITVKEALEGFPMGGLSVGESQNLGDFIANLVRNLLDYLIVIYIEQKSMELAAALEFFGVIDRSTQNAGSTNPVFPEYIRRRVNFNNIPDLFSDPGKLAANLYDWGKPNFTGAKMIEKLHKLALSFNLPAIYNPGVPELDISFLKIRPKLSVSPPGLEILISDTFRPGAMVSFGSTEWNVTTAFTSEIPAEAGIILKPGLEIEVVPPVITGPINGDLTVTFTMPGVGAPPNPYVAIGDPAASRFEFKEFRLEAGAGLTWDGGKATGRFHVEGELTEGKIVIKPKNPDGFLAKVLPPEGISLDFSLLMGYDSTRGFYFDGSGGLEIQLPLHLSLGPILVDKLTLGIRAGSGGIPIEMGADIGLSLGPFQAIVQNMGIKANFTFPPNKDGNLGFANADIDFKPPTGVGLSIDAGVVKGGGFLSFDFEKGRYTGIVQLSIANMVNVVAIGIITTKNPDGSPGFSMLLLITAEFTPIQLGFGFTLLGVGGLVGVNRTMVLQALRDGVRNNTLDNILFPSDPIANATSIISSLETIFPQQQDRFVFGPMGKIGWGTPTLVSLELGLMLEVPNPIRLAILGVLKMVLPTEEAAILKLQVAFVGTIDFEAKYLTFDASLFDSRLLIFTLEGDMALRVKWGDESNFLFTVGGFHPDYVPPPLDLPQLRRLSISLLSGNPRLTISTYFAVTSNTVQFGAGIDFYFKVGPCKVKGWLYFDALFQFNPFYFKISVSAGFGVYLWGAEVLSISFYGSLEGPTPWHIEGRIKFKILFVIKVNVSIAKTWGETKNTSLPNIAVLPKLKEALENKGNWITPLEQGATGVDSLVNMRTITDAPDSIIAHPDKSLSVSQKVVPLDLEITRFGTQRPSDFTKFSIELEAMTEDSVKEEFAPAEFLDLSEAKKLGKSFEKYNSGVTAKGASKLVSDYFTERDVFFEEIIIDDIKKPSPVSTLRAMDAKRFNAFIKNGAAAKSKFGTKASLQSPLSPSKVAIATEEYTVVNTDTLGVHANIKVSSLAEANAMLNQAIASDPALEGKLEIMSQFELA